LFAPLLSRPDFLFAPHADVQAATHTLAQSFVCTTHRCSSSHTHSRNPLFAPHTDVQAATHTRAILCLHHPQMFRPLATLADCRLLSRPQAAGLADAVAMTLATAMVNPLASIALKPEGDIKCVWVYVCVCVGVKAGQMPLQ